MIPTPSLTSESRLSELETGKCSILEVSFNILNCTVGSGILALSFAIKESGFGLGIILSIIVAILCWLALYILIVTGKQIGVFRYAMLCEAAMGKGGFHLLNSVIFFQSAGACVTYMIVVGDTIPVVLDAAGFEVSRQWIILGCSLVFILPLLFYRTIGPLAKVSIVSVMTLPPILFVVAVRGVYYGRKLETRPLYSFFGDGPERIFPAIAIMAFAMLSTQTAFMNFSSMKDPSRRSWAKATGLAVSLSWLISFFIAIIGYMSFGESVAANIFNSFPQQDVWINFARGLLGFSMFLTFPQAFYPARAAAHKVLGHETTHTLPTDREHVFTTVSLFIPILLCGVFISDLGLLYQLIGGFCSTFLAYIIPGMCYFLIFWSKDSSHGSDSSDAQGQDRYEDSDDEQSLLQKPAEKQSHGFEERGIGQTSTSSSPLAPAILSSTTYGSSSYSSPSSSSSSTSPSGERHFLRFPSRHDSGRPRRTALWLDVGAAILVAFGVFVMVVATTSTLKKMAGYV